METNNKIISNYANSLNNAAIIILNTVANLNDSEEENNATIRTVNVLLESLRSQTIILQNAIDNYKGV